MIKNALSYLRRLNEEHRSAADDARAECLDKLLDEFADRGKTADELYELLCSVLADDDSPFENAVISVLSCVVCKAYIAEGQSCLPEDLEALQTDKIDGFFSYLSEYPSAEECYRYFCREVCL